MLARLLMKQGNKTTGKNVFCIWNFKETKPVDFWPGAIYCLNSSAYFHSKMKLMRADATVSLVNQYSFGSMSSFLFCLKPPR